MTVIPAARKATAFQFAKDLRNPDLRQHLTEFGHNPDTDVVLPYGPPETRDQALARATRDGRRILLAGMDPNTPTGWTFTWEEETKP